MMLSFFVLLCVLHQAAGNCSFAAYYRGQWFSIERINGSGIQTVVTQQKWGTLNCVESHYEAPVPGLFGRTPLQPIVGRNASFLLVDHAKPGCVYCQQVLWRTPNVLQIRKEEICNRAYNFTQECVPKQPSIYEVTTYFKSMDEEFIDCQSTFPNGIYNFTYEHRARTQGTCDDPENKIKVCDDGFLLHLNPTFYMVISKCPRVLSMQFRAFRFQCYGSWFARSGNDVYKFAALRDTVEKTPRKAYLCLMAVKNEIDQHGTVHWWMNESADCSSFSSVHDVSSGLEMTRFSSCYSHV